MEVEVEIEVEVEVEVVSHDACAASSELKECSLQNNSDDEVVALLVVVETISGTTA